MSKTATINATGGTGTKTYSINGTTYQSSNTFTGLADGSYTAYVKDANNCVATQAFDVTSATVPTYNAGSPCQPTAAELEGFLYDENHYAVELGYLHSEEIGGGAGGMVSIERTRLFYYGSDNPNGSVSLTTTHNDTGNGYRTITWAPSYNPNGTHNNELLDLTKITSNLISTQNLVAVQRFFSSNIQQGYTNAHPGIAVGPAKAAMESLLTHKLTNATPLPFASLPTFGPTHVGYSASTSGVVPYRIPTYCDGEGHVYLAGRGEIDQIENQGALDAHVTAVANTTSTATSETIYYNVSAYRNSNSVTAGFLWRTVYIYPIKKV